MIFPQKGKIERKRKQTRRKWFAKYYLKAKTVLNDESQTILTTNLLVKNQHGILRQIQENLNTVDSLQLEPYREIEKRSTYWELEANNQK